ncbi:MAG TPA: sigma factor-like helix-turn-helix DNA-binding protein [Gaiellaceae bacterium]
MEVSLVLDDEPMWIGATLILALSKLTEWEREAVIAHHVRNETLDQIARRRGVTRQAASISEQKGLAKLRAELAPLRDQLLPRAA